MEPVSAALITSTILFLSSVLLSRCMRSRETYRGVSSSKKSFGEKDAMNANMMENEIVQKKKWANGLAVVTRIHTASASKMVSVEKVESFIRDAHGYADKIIICIGFKEQDPSNTGDHLNEYIKYCKLCQQHIPSNLMAKVVLLPIVPWGNFTSALNAAIVKVMAMGYKSIAFQSLEFRLGISLVNKIRTFVESNEHVLMAGPAMQGHIYISGKNKLSGRTCPWNTFAIWSMTYLGRIGFPLIGDAFGTDCGGVEEVTTISLLQYMYPKCVAVLLKVEGIHWQTDFSDPLRAKWHEEKMNSKDRRPGSQLEFMELPESTVIHQDL